MADADPASRPAPEASILLVEDEPGIRDFVEQGLQDAGFAVSTASGGETGLTLALREPFSLVVLDLVLPDRSGLEVLAELRPVRPQLPVIVLTALGQTEDRVRGLDCGANDYLVKPFSVRELIARIRAQLRQVAVTQITMLRTGALEIDLLTRRVWVLGRRVHLSSTEFQLLQYFVQNPGRVLTRRQILRAVWGYEHETGTNAIEVYIGYLRRKLRHEHHELPLVTIRSVGYRFEADAAG